MTLSMTPGWTALHLMGKFPLLSVVILSTVYFFPESNKPMIAITFDDGRKSVIETAVPILNESDIVATAYISTGLLGQPSYMSSEDVTSISEIGWEIGSHTINHEDMTSLSDQIMIINLSLPKKFLEAITGTEIKSFSSPYGAFNDSVIENVKKYHASHVNAWDDKNGVTTIENLDPYNISRFTYTKDVSTEEICSVAGNLANDSLFVIAFHDVVENHDSPWNVDQKTLNEILNCLKETNVEFVTVSQGIERLMGE